jgi:hypothetical protein
VAREIKAEDCLGKQLLTPGGIPIGRIKELEIVPEGDVYVVRSVITGPLGVLAQVGAFADQVPVLRLFGFGRAHRPRSFRAEWVDLSDPEHPRLTVGHEQP